MDLKWQTDQVKCVLEVSSTQDSELCTLYSLLVDLEKAGLVDTVVSGHTCVRPAGALVSDSMVDSFEVAPKDTLLFFKYGEPGRQLRFTNCASAVPASALRQSPRLQEVWRMQYLRQDKELSPKKPLWFLREPVALTKGECLRLI